ncbi:MAG: helix-turn-helix transcriptional regulator [Bacteroidota bacterium]
MIRLRIPQLAQEKGIKHVFTALTKGGLTAALAHDYMQDKKERLVMEDIELMCLVFRCLPNDLFEVVPDKPGTADLTQPIYIKLAPRTPFNLLEATKHMSPDEVREMLQEHAKRKKQEEGIDEKLKKD